MSGRTALTAGLAFGLVVLAMSGPAAATLPSDGTGEMSQPQSGRFDPLRLYGGRIEFDIFRNGTQVGDHSVVFEPAGPDLKATSRFHLEVPFLFITAYRFSYESVALWQGDRMVSLTATTDDGGDRTRVEAAWQGESLQVIGPQGVESDPAPIFPTDHWHPGVLEADRVVNTITGSINQVALTEQGTDTVETERGPVLATHYAYTGDLATDIWFDRSGRWVKLRFEAKDGSTVEFRCRLCQGGAARQVNADRETGQ